MSTIKEQYKQYKKASKFEAVVEVAKRLLEQYGTSSNIPDVEFTRLEEKGALNAATVKAVTIIIEREGGTFKITPQ